ncbi:MAG: hypothetical protein ABSE95_16270 [Thermodesulfobacteriota bacterium]
MSYQILITLAFITAFVFFLFLTIGGNLVFGFLVWLFAAIFIPSAVFLISTPGFPDIYLERII